ncbi:peptidoglycan editing factor PgeF [Roseibium suaedae]|uniref:Purine nucleoside phosphorylase n=1 Tax=Roseibium suaedae TaxID=735517 RepID=A0A1M7HNG9_9HYPH|nr:peptidoglycan editing factor PgeF [Roseibium suaedae]SHM30092.1 conserved hypothetical protein [Roseibium suaedae]
MIEAKELKFPGISHGFFTRQGGVSNGIYTSLNTGLGSDDNRSDVLENRRRIAGQLNVDPSLLVTPYQVHSPDVIHLDAPWTEDQDRKADALVTSTPGLAIGVSTADCGPVLFADPEARVVGAAHSGWKGAVTGVLENTIAAMEKLGAKRERITAVLGPTISRAAYEVGPEFQQRFVDSDEGNSAYFSPSDRADHHFFDLPAFIVNRLKTAGVGQAVNLDLCTYADEDRFFSYRRTTHRKEPDYGRLLHVIVLTGD